MASVWGVASEVYVGLALYIFLGITRSRPLRLTNFIDFTPDSPILFRHRDTAQLFCYGSVYLVYLTEVSLSSLVTALTAFRVAAFKAEILCCLVACIIATTSTHKLTILQRTHI